MAARVSALRQSLIEWGLVALTALFGMQILRVLFSSLIYVLRDRLGWSAIQLGLLGLVIFLSAFLAAWVRRVLGPRGALIVTAGGVSLCRLLLQIWSGDPLGNLYLGIAGAVFLVLFLPIYLGHARSRAAGLFVPGLLLGLAADLAIQGAYGSYDVAWQHNAGTLALVALLVLAQGVLLACVVRAAQDSPGDSPWGPGLAIGPFVFLELLIFENIAWLNGHTGWNLPAGLATGLLSHAAGLAAAAWLLSRPARRPWLTALLGGVVLVLATTIPPTRNTPLAAAGVVLLGQVAAAALLTVTVAGLDSRPRQPGLLRITLAHGIAMVLLVMMLFVYYGSIDIRLPFSAALVPPAAALVIALCAVAAGRTPAEKPAASAAAWLPAGAAAVLLLVPLVMIPAWQPAETISGQGLPVRVLQYNLHNGFDTQGYLGLEAIARNIENQKPDIVSLQEVSRGWVVNGSSDMLLWLSHRLNMPYVYGPTMDSLWGNAILSRYPVRSVEEHKLPPDNLLLRRGFLAVQVDLGQGNTLQVISTHFHQIEGDSEIRVQQSRVLLEYWKAAANTVVMGDFNAAPGDPEIAMLSQAGLRDVCALAGLSPCLSSPSDRPSRQIDYIWLSPDLNAQAVVLPASTASDHLAIAATVGR